MARKRSVSPADEQVSLGLAHREEATQQQPSLGRKTKSVQSNPYLHSYAQRTYPRFLEDETRNPPGRATAIDDCDFAMIAEF